MRDEQGMKATFDRSAIKKIAREWGLLGTNMDASTLAGELRSRYGKVYQGGANDEYDYECDCGGITINRLRGRTPGNFSWISFAKEIIAISDEHSGALIDAAAARKTIEAQIGVYMRGAYQNMVEVGRCLVRAKEEKIVPHGEWEGWVQAQTGFTVRQAQRLMQAAKAVPAGSAMAQLPISKIQLLLALPEEEREVKAQRVLTDNTTVEQLRQEIKAAKDAGEEKVKQVRAQLDQVIGLRMEAEKKLQALEAQLKDQGDNDEVRQLRQELEEMEQYAAEQARARKQAQEELLNARMSGNDSSEHHRFGAADLDQAVRAFIGDAGIIGQMGAELSRLDQQTRSDMLRQVARVAQWVEDARKALNTHLIDAPESSLREVSGSAVPESEGFARAGRACETSQWRDCSKGRCI